MADSADDRCARRHAFLVALLACVLYLPSLTNGFVNWDDDILIVKNEAVGKSGGLTHIWSTFELPDGYPNYPLLFTSFWIDHQLWGLNPAGYHAVNVLLHTANAALVLMLARSLGAPAFPSLLTGLAFAVHPIHVESVAWVSERKNLLSTFFYLCAFLSFLRHRRTGEEQWYGVALLMFIAALLSKTAALTLPVSLLAMERLRSGRWERAVIVRLAPMLAVATVAAAATASVERPMVAGPLATRPLVAAAAFLFYACKLVVPWPLLPIYPRWEVSLGFLWLLPLIALLVSAVAWAWGRGWRWRWGVAHFGCSLLPVIGLVPFGFLEYSFVADHHTYLPSVGLLLAGALALGRWRGRRRGKLVDIPILLAVLCASAVTSQQIGVWRDSESLWQYTIRGNPNAYAAHNNLGLALADMGKLDEARVSIKRAIELYPEYDQAYNNLGMVAYRQRDFAAAEGYARMAVKLRPQAAAYRKNLALAQQSQGKYAEAIDSLRAAIELEPLNANFRYLLGNALQRATDLAAAAGAYREALRLQPDLLDACSQLGRVLLALSRNKEAVDALGTVVRLAPQSAEAHFNLALALIREGRTADATAHLKQAVALRPDFPAARAEIEKLRSTGS
jgi:protein O-mannosyl-transferase